MQAAFNPLRPMDGTSSCWLVLLSPDRALGTFRPHSVLTPYKWFLVLNIEKTLFALICVLLPGYQRDTTEGV